MLLPPLVLVGGACANPPSPVSPDSVAAPAAEPVPEAPPPLRPLTEEEQRLRGEVEGEVTALSALGPRSLAHSWNLYTATDHLARRLEVMGYEVTRQGFEVGDEVLQNLEVVVPGSQSGETVIVAAHYDTSPESPGANASATGSAVLMSLARDLVGRKHARSIRMVWLANESGGQGMPGSAVYAKRAQQQSIPIVATLTLGSLGHYSLTNGSQRYPEELLYGAERRPRLGNFIAVVSNPSSNALLDQVRGALAEASLPVEELILPDLAPLAADGPQARFWRAGLNGLMLTDTAQFRSLHHDDAMDVIQGVDFDRLARVAGLVRPVLASLAGPLAAKPPVPAAPEAGSPAAGSPAAPQQAAPVPSAPRPPG